MYALLFTDIPWNLLISGKRRNGMEFKFSLCDLLWVVMGLIIIVNRTFEAWNRYRKTDTEVQIAYY